MEQDEYNKEEIDWSYIEFVDNQEILDLIEKVSFTKLYLLCCVLFTEVLFIIVLSCLRKLVVSFLSWMRLGMTKNLIWYCSTRIVSFSFYI